MKINVHIEQSSSRPIAIIRRRASKNELSKVVPEICGIVWDVVRTQQITGVGRNIAVYLDDQINLEVGVELDAPIAGYGEVVGSATPFGPVATTTHFGPYAQLNAAHATIRQWCKAQGHTLAGPSWEIYGHWKDEWNRDPTKIATDIYYLLVADESRSHSLRPK